MTVTGREPLWRRITEPPASVADPEERRRGRLVAALALSLGATAVAASLLLPTLGEPGAGHGENPGALVGLVVSATLAAPYALARAGRVKAATWTMALLAIGGTWAGAIANHALDGTTPLFFLGITLLIASLLLSPGETAALAGANAVALLLYPLAFPAVAFSDVSLPLGFLALLAVLVHVHAGIRREAQAKLDRQTRRLAEEEARYRALFETSFEGLTIDEAGVVSDGNPRFGPLFGYDDEEVNGRPLASFLAPESRCVLDSCSVDDAAPVEATGLRRDGSTFPVALLRRTTRHHGRPARVIAWRDLTEERQAEAELESSRKRIAMSEKLSALGTLVAGVGHEVNNPLAYMRGTVDLAKDMLDDLLARDDLPEKVRADLREIRDNEDMVLRGIGRIDHITASLKRVARAGNGARTPEDVNTLLDSVLTVAGPRLRGFPVERSFEARREASANGAEVSQVLLNLVFNASDALSGREGARLLVRTYDAGPHVVVEVEDNGPGIDPAAQAKIFTPFHTTKHHGTGLGLSLSYRILEDHGGRLSFESRPGRTVFRVELPACPPPGQEPQAASVSRTAE